jgi:hypothetical protein
MAVNSQLRLIPVWLRLLAALLAAVAALATVLLVRTAPDQAVGVASAVRLAAQALLFVGVLVLAGYVAATGLPPSHWWRSAGRPVWPLQPDLPLTPDLQRFLARLRERHAGIRECWLLDSVTPGEWRLLAIAGPSELEALRGDWDIRRKDVRLYLLDEATRTVALAWGRSSPVAFRSWDWEPQAESVAEFRCPMGGDVRLAQRLWATVT